MRRVRSNHVAINLPTLRLEGGLFLPDQLEKAALGRASWQSEADYRTPRGLSLKDDYSRAFQIAGAQWRQFSAGFERSDLDAAGVTRDFLLELLRDAFGYATVAAVNGITHDDRCYPVSLLAGELPIIVAPHTMALDEADARFAIIGGGSRKKSPFQAAQELLNASPRFLWALVSNGRQIRLLRDAATLTRPSYLEVDLEDLLGASRFSEFANAWRLLHASRSDASVTEGAFRNVWEAWREAGQEEGTRVRDGLRHGVTQALITLGNGFLQHPANEALRRQLHDGRLDADGYFQQLLRLIYRFLFLFNVEERDVLHVAGDTTEALAARRAYVEGYAVGRLRELSLRRRARNRFDDHWQALRIVFKGLAHGEPRLALPALGGLFADTQCVALDAASLDNAHLLSAMQHLRWTSHDGALAPVDYRNMGPEELGSVYESLLELVPEVELTSRQFGFVGVTSQGSTAGNTRKITGSYYTPDSLVQELIKSALNPVIEQRLASNPTNPIDAILSIRVIDPACGSGHFLLAAARRLAETLAQLRASDGAVKPQDYRHALREVVSRCIFGVDRNPMALELARTALWLEGFEEGRPLSFLDHHLRCGDALLGLMDLKFIEKGIPKDAFKALSGDDKEVCKALVKANTSGLKRLQRDLQAGQSVLRFDQIPGVEQLKAIDLMSVHNTQDVASVEREYLNFLQEAGESRLAQVADLVVGAFLLPKSKNNADVLPTSELLHRLVMGDTLRGDLEAKARAQLSAARSACVEARVLHWPLAFPQVFAVGGFDCVLGNPPWEMLQLDPQEFFAVRAPHVANAPNMAARDREIDALKAAYPRIYSEYQDALRRMEATQAFVHANERFEHSGTGRINLSSLFTETCLRLVGTKGRAGIVCPSGIATDSFTQGLWGHITDGRLVSFFDFENRRGIFVGVHRSFKFCLLTMGASSVPDFAFFLTATEQVGQAERRFQLTSEDFQLINPNTRTCPIFRSQADAELTKKLYRRWPVLWREAQGEQSEENPWGLELQLMFMMNTDSIHFLNRASPTSLPLYEAKMVHQFDHRWATYRWDAATEKVLTEDVADAQKACPDLKIQPRYWIEERHVLSRLARVPRGITKAWDEQSEDRLRSAFGSWIVTSDDNQQSSGLHRTSLRDRAQALGGHLFGTLPFCDAEWFDDRLSAEARDLQPLCPDELALLRGSPDLLTATREILDRRTPRWLMGWRDITNATNERTVIASVLPRSGVGDTLLLMFPRQNDPRLYACLLADQNSVVHDYIARQKIGGTHLKFHVKKQLVNLPPSAYSLVDIDYIVSRVLELTYTSNELKPWAQELGYNGPVFGYDPTRRARLRAELDARYASIYGLNRDELRYILDPSTTHGVGYPTETFRGLKSNELRDFGEYRTQRLVLEAWDKLERGELK